MDFFYLAQMIDRLREYIITVYIKYISTYCTGPPFVTHLVSVFVVIFKIDFAKFV